MNTPTDSPGAWHVLKKSDLVRGLQHEFPDGIQRGLGLQGLSLSHVEPRVQGTLEVRDTATVCAAQPPGQATQLAAATSPPRGARFGILQASSPSRTSPGWQQQEV